MQRKLLENYLSSFHEIKEIADAAIARGVMREVVSAKDGNRRKMDFSTYYS